MNKSLEKFYTSFIDFWREVCMVFFSIAGMVCSMIIIILMFRGKNLILDTSLFFPPLAYLCLVFIFASAIFYLAKHEILQTENEALKKANDRLEKDNSKNIKIILELTKECT